MENMSASLWGISSRLHVLEDRLVAGNERKKLLEDSIKKVETKLNVVKRQRNLYNSITTALRNCIQDYQISRRKAIAKSVDIALNSVFPDEKYHIRFATSFDSKGNPLAWIETGTLKKGVGPDADLEDDSNYNWSLPEDVHGNLGNQIILYTVNQLFSIMQGADWIFSDEALAGGDNASLRQFAPILEYFSSLVNLILIDHKRDMYSLVSRREICIDKMQTEDNPTGFSFIESILDFETDSSCDGASVTNPFVRVKDMNGKVVKEFFEADVDDSAFTNKKLMED